MAMHARPVPSNPYNPKSTSPNTSEGTTHYPSPFVPIRLPVFAPVLWINDRVVSLLNVVGGGRVSGSRSLNSNLRSSATSMESAYGGGTGGMSGMGRKRGMSDATVESVEEGTGDSGVAEASAARRVAMGEFASGMGGRRRKAE